MVDKQYENYKLAKEQAKLIRENPISDVSNYMLMPLEERFKKLMVLYEELEPDWKEEYQKVEERKPKKLKTDLKAENILDAINGAIGEDVIEMALSMFGANKIAHQCPYIRDDIIKYHLKEKGINIANKDLFDTIETALDSETKKIPGALDKLKKKLNQKYGISKEIFDDLEKEHGDDIRTITQMRRAAFYIKDFEMDNLIEELKDRNDISYGKCLVPKEDGIGKKDGKTPKMTNLFVVDLPYYGQFSVHMKTESSISALSNTPYNALHVYEKESVMMTRDISEGAMKYFVKKTSKREVPSIDTIMPHLKKLVKDNPRFAHYIAVKLGATKEEMDKMYEGEER